MNAKSTCDRFAWWPAVAVLTLAGLVLRIAAAARGGLWTDEAWSMVYAQQARDPLGVFLRINHDNNHHLNSLWMQAVGMHASPLLVRAPAILAGTLTIPAAALLFARRSAAGAIAAAALFALSPMMVTYGSEARGYSSMMLAALIMMRLVTDEIDGRNGRFNPLLGALIAALGMLSNLTMLAPVVLLTLWIYLERRSSIGSAKAVRSAIAIMGPALIASVAVLLLVLAAAMASRTGLQVGGYTPFSFHGYAVALANLTGWTAGLTFRTEWLAIIALAGIGVAVFVRAPSAIGPRARLYGLLILGVPVVIAAERTGNAQFARYYLCSAIGLLLLGAEWIEQSIKADRTQRALCAIACGLFLVTAFWRDGQLIELGRGQPDRAIRLMADEAPRGARVGIDTYQLTAPMIVAAKEAGYPVSLAGPCAPAQFMIVAREAHSMRTATRCGHPMQEIGWSEAPDLTGDSWVLYRAEGFQSAGHIDTGPAPTAENRRISGRAGVAQG